MVDFEEFKNFVAGNIVNYLPERYENAVVSIHEVTKKNDVHMTGLMINAGGGGEMTTVYLEGLYEQYVSGREMIDIMRDIAAVQIRHDMEPDIDVDRLMDFEQIKDQIVCRLVNVNMNEDYLADKPYTQIEDLAATYAIDLGAGEYERKSVPVKKSLMARYGITVEELHNTAIHNLSESNIEFISMRDMIAALGGGELSEDDPEISLYVLTNAERENGAAAILDKKTMTDISVRLGGDFIVLPSSIHEVIILPVAENVDRQGLEDMVRDINESQVKWEERLSDHVYQYDSQRRVLVRMDKMEEYKKNEIKGGTSNMSDVDFVTIDLSKKQVDFDHARENEKNGKEYVRVFAPEGGVFFYPRESLKENADNKNRVHFSRPVGTEIVLHFSERNPDVPDNAPASEKYVNSTRVVKIEDLKEMYRQEWEKFAEDQKQKRENSTFVNVTVPTSWGREFSGKDPEQKFVSISVPIREGEKSNYYSFVLPAERFKESTMEEGMSYFSFPRKKMDSDEDYMVTLKRSEKQPGGEYKEITKEISSEELVAAVKRAKEVQREKLEVEVSEKLLHQFSSKDGKSLVSVSVPVYDEKQGRDVFYSIVVPENYVSDAEKEGQKKVSLSAEYEFTAKRGVKDEATGQYNDVEMKITGAEIKKAFEESKERYAEQQANESLQAEQDERKQAAQEQQRPHVKRGR